MICSRSFMRVRMCSRMLACFHVWSLLIMIHVCSYLLKFVYRSICCTCWLGAFLSGDPGSRQVFWITFHHPVDVHAIQPSEVCVRLRRRYWDYWHMDFPRSSISQRETERQVALVGGDLWKRFGIFLWDLLVLQVICSYLQFVFWIARTLGLLSKEFQSSCLLCREAASQACSALSMVRPNSGIQHNAQLLFARNCEEWGGLHDKGRVAIVWLCPKIFHLYTCSCSYVVIP